MKFTFHENELSIDKNINRLRLTLILIIVFEFGLKLFLIFNQKIGWDEFYFLSKVYSYQRGDLTEPFQNFHVHFLGWLPWISINEITQIIAARCSLFILLAASGFFIYMIAKRFIDHNGALFAVFCWISFSNIIQHGASLRYDSFCAFLFLVACFVLLKENRTSVWPAIAGLLMGLSLLISLKAAIHIVSLLALLGAFKITSIEKELVYKKTALFITSLTLTFGLGFTIHRSMLPETISPHESFLYHASSKAIIHRDFFPQVGYFAESLRNNSVTWWLLGVGVFYAIFEFKRNRTKNGLIALTFLVPLLSLPFYRNAFPYYYTFIMAPAVIFCGILPQRLLQGYRDTTCRTPLLIVVIIGLSIAGSAGTHFFRAFTHENRSQAQLFNVLHKMFPNPVPYIDGCSAVASYPNVAFFMSTWGFENYLAEAKPVFRKILQERHPQFLLADTPHLDFTLPPKHQFFKINYDFLEEDRKILEQNFVPFWGTILLPGKTLFTERAGEKISFEILIPGPYIIQSNEKIILDNKSRLPREQIILTNGRHTAQASENHQKIVLRWAQIEYEPQSPAPAMSTFYGF